MSEEQSVDMHCKVTLMLNGYSGVSSIYSARDGLKREIVLTGYVYDPYISPMGDDTALDNPDSYFNGKRVYMKIHSPSDKENIKECDVCGSMWVRAGVEPEKVELDGEEVEVEPIRIMIYLKPDEFDVIHAQISEITGNQRIISAILTLVGDALPTPDDADVSSILGLSAKDLDTSTSKSYGITRLELSQTRFTNNLRDRVLPVENDHTNGYGSNISVILTAARYQIHVEHARFHSISYEGRVIKCTGKPYENADVTIEFSEHRPNRYGDFPEKACYGEFSYYVREDDNEYSQPYFLFYLQYMPNDVRDILIPLVNQESGARLLVHININVENSELFSVKNRVPHANRCMEKRLNS